jgi:hypothetical protein
VKLRSLATESAYRSCRKSKFDFLYVTDTAGISK